MHTGLSAPIRGDMGKQAELDWLSMVQTLLARCQETLGKDKNILARQLYHPIEEDKRSCRKATHNQVETPHVVLLCKDKTVFVGNRVPSSEGQYTLL